MAQGASVMMPSMGCFWIMRTENYVKDLKNFTDNKNNYLVIVLAIFVMEDFKSSITMESRHV